MSARYVRFTRPDGEDVWINVNDPPRRIARSSIHKGKVMLMWSSDDTQIVNETIEQVRTEFGLRQTS